MKKSLAFGERVPKYLLLILERSYITVQEMHS